MSVLCDWEIKALCEAGMIEGYSDDLINPASLDVRLGGHLMIEVADTKDFVNVDISHRTEKNPYRLMPGEFCLAETEEIFTSLTHLALSSSLNQAEPGRGMRICLQAGSILDLAFPKALD